MVGGALVVVIALAWTGAAGFAGTLIVGNAPAVDAVLIIVIVLELGTGLALAATLVVIVEGVAVVPWS